MKLLKKIVLSEWVGYALCGLVAAGVAAWIEIGLGLLK